MKRQQLPLYAVALAVLIVGLAFAGVPTGTLLILPLILACPLMMMFMMRGMDHGTAHPDSRDQKHTDPGSQPNDARQNNDPSNR